TLFRAYVADEHGWSFISIQRYRYAACSKGSINEHDVLGGVPNEYRDPVSSCDAALHEGASNLVGRVRDFAIRPARTAPGQTWCVRVAGSDATECIDDRHRDYAV